MASANLIITVTVRIRDHRAEAHQKRRRYRRERRELIARLGGVCVACGCARPRLLEFDHTEPREWDARKHNQLTRLRRYAREAAAGKIELRCRSCNASKGAPTAEGCDF